MTIAFSGDSEMEGEKKPQISNASHDVNEAISIQSIMSGNE